MEGSGGGGFALAKMSTMNVSFIDTSSINALKGWVKSKLKL